MFRLMAGALALAVLYSHALAQANSEVHRPGAVIRCEFQGKVSYGSVPCTGGTVLPAVEAKPISSNTARLKHLGDQMASERHQREASEDRERKKAAMHQRHCDQLQLRKKWADEDAASASASARAKAKRHARRQAEIVSLNCS